jgi:hypothetical protein
MRMISLRIFSASASKSSRIRAATPFVLAHEPEQDVLGADVVVTERERLAQRKLEHLLGARRERDLPARDLVALTDDPSHLRAHLLDGDVERLEHARGETLLLTQKPEQNVLRADVVVLQRTRLVLSEDNDLPGTFGESLEQCDLSLLGRPAPRPPSVGSAHGTRDRR